MPQVISYTPAWLGKGTPGYDIFTGAPGKSAGTYTASSNGSSTTKKKNVKPGPRRTIARRGTEIFTAVGREIRWADLAYLKEAWIHKEETKNGSSKGKGREGSPSQYDEDHAQGYRTLKVSVAEDIKQLIISPHTNYLAILTTHTVHIAILPDSSHLTAFDTSPLKPRTYTLGPETHVTSQAAIASALWHPLGVNGSCLVTVTEDAVVRVWELSLDDRWSFDRPTLSIDLKKLADGTSFDQDFEASKPGVNTGFSPDSFEMEVASACFAGRESGGWSPMTLWIAMREGDVYALCPLLPEKWSPPPTLIPALSVSIVAKVAAIEDDQDVAQGTRMLAQQQLAWMSDLDNQEPAEVESPLGEPHSDVYIRPIKPGKVPKLQGPFDFELAPEESEDELDSLLTDIYVIGPKLDVDELMFGEENDLEIDDPSNGLSLGVVCLLTSSGRLSISLDLDGVEAQWLPRPGSKVLKFLDDADPPSLLTFQVLDTSRTGEVWEGNWPMFSSDFTSRYSFFVTGTSSVTYISLTPWVFTLENELRDSGAGAEFRIDLMVKAHNSLRERVYTAQSEDRSSSLASSVAMRDPDLGYFVLTATPYHPAAVTFESPDTEEIGHRPRSPTFDSEPLQPLIIVEPRPVYQPAHALEEQSALPSLLEKLRHSKYKRLLKEDIRLSPATLHVMTDAHKVLSEETHRLGTAAAELFRRCERLQIELQSQIKKVHEVAGRVDEITGDDRDDEPAADVNERVEARILKASNRQKELTDRIEKLRRQATKATGRELTDKERGWAEEVVEVQSAVLGEGDTADDFETMKQPWVRFDEVNQLKDELLDQIQDLAAEDARPASRGVKVPSEIRKAKMAQITALLNRETALVEGAKNRLDRLRSS
ncbi:Nucleoporin [Lachnellula occidentalis]|uniref:Nucleoporin n=1 Tax=Lachnellula occidentalis TaxID=215460 RepID=A0A8H8UH81_9HELO|nr:Nucleoporin [Lachnellula occidentalis]